MSLDSVLREIDAYPVPEGVKAETWAMLVAELKKQIIARSKDGKTLSIAPTGLANTVSDLAAASNPAGTQATVTWTEKLAGDCNNDGEVSIADLQPIAAHYGETSTGPGSAAYLADANGDGEVGITDLQPIAADYSMHVEGYQVFRGAYTGTTTTWESVHRPNSNPANANWSADRTASPPAMDRPAYTYLDDISGLTDKTNVRFKVVPYGDGAGGVESNEAIMPPPGTVTHSVSGTVTESSTGLGGVTMTLTPGGLSATTIANGTYAIDGVADGTYTLTPTMTGHSFTPPTRSVNVSGADVTGRDFTATLVLYSVSGTVTSGGLGLAGIQMTLDPGGLNATTAANGTYTIPGVAGGSYTLTPSLTGYTFTPPTRSVNVSGADVTGQDFVAAPGGHSVSGTVTESSVGLAGVTLTLTPGGLNATTAANGTYTITGVADGSYTLTPSKASYTFTPPTRSVNVSGADVTGQDFAATAIPLTYNVSGTVTLLGSGLPGVLMTLSPGGQNATTLADGTYTIPGVTNGNYTLTPSLTGYRFTPMSLPVTVSGADVTGQDFTATHVGLGNTPWPKFQADPGNTGRSPYVGPQTDYLKWTYTTGGNVEGSPAIGQDGTVYIGSGDCKVHAINPDGSVKWTYTTGGYIDTAPAIDVDGTLYIGTQDQKLYALNSADGSLKWAIPLPGAVTNSAAIGADGTIYIGCRDNNVYAINPGDGSVKWTHATGNWITGCPAIGSDGTVYIGNYDGNVYALNPIDGSAKWTHATGDMIEGSAAIGADGTVYIGSDDHSLYALDPGNGSVKWTRATGDWIHGAPAIGADGTVYVGSEDSTLYALSPADGSDKWSYSCNGTLYGSLAIAADGTLYIGCEDSKVYAFSNPPTYSVSGTVTEGAVGLPGVLMTLTPGGQSATTQADGTYVIPGVSDGDYTLTPTTGGHWFAPPFRDAYVSGADVTGQDFAAAVSGLAESPWPKFRGNEPNTGQSLHVGAQTNTVKWTYTATDQFASSPAIAADGTVYIGCLNANLYALNPADGSKKWSYAIGGTIESSPAVAADGSVYFGGTGGTVYALNPDGTQKWYYTTSGGIYGSPAIGADGTVYIGSTDCGFYALDPADGSVKWTHACSDEVRGSAAIGVDGTVYFGSYDGHLYALNPIDGSVKWSYYTGGGSIESSPAIGSDGTIVFGGIGGSVRALNPNGSLKWSYGTGGPVYSSPAIDAYGSVYIGSDDGKVYKLALSDGSLIWSYTTGGSVKSSPAVGADGLVYVGSGDKSVYALWGGSAYWSYATGGGVKSSPAIGADGTVYVGSRDNKVYAFWP